MRNIFFDNIDSLAYIISAIAAVSSAIAAIYAAKGVNEQKKMRILESCPFLIISKIEAFQLCEEDGFPIGIYFINVGKGFAQIRVIDLNDSKIKANIGTPISIPPGDTYR
ncbi:MAG TPA: hypothetical protein GXX35_04440 [Thermoanaerobacterales bacterium]|nr:hypothetical protein [Thermoanaerobacterales bacterium]